MSAPSLLELKVMMGGRFSTGSWYNFKFGRKLCLLQLPYRFRIPTLNKGSQPIELPSLGGGWAAQSGSDAPWEILNQKTQ